MTPEMRAARVGKLTASMAAVIMGGLDTKGLSEYICSLAFERHFGDSGEDSYESPAMRRGKELEERALEWYAFDQDCLLTPGGVCVDHPSLPFVAASPDARRPDRVIEVKCLLHKAWLDARLRNEIPAEYRWQARWQQWVCGVRLVDFVIWHPIAGGFVVQRSVTDDECEQMASRALLVNEMVDEQIARMRRRIAA